MGFNKGEWSELYSFLYLIRNPGLVCINEDMQIIGSGPCYQIKELFVHRGSDKEIAFKIEGNVLTKISSTQRKQYRIEDIETSSTILLSKINAHIKGKGAFEISELQPLIDDLLDGEKIKGSAWEKGDLEARVINLKTGLEGIYKYNVKSYLGALPTMLNASSHTNFIFEVIDINDSNMQECNKIIGASKLLKRYKYLAAKGAVFQFTKAESCTLSASLSTIHPALESTTAKMLLLSYSENLKDIKELVAKLEEDPEKRIELEKIIGSFANAVTFGLRASQSWNGDNEAEGGIIMIDRSGQARLLDLINSPEIVHRYLINNIKLESPSSTRYHMFDIYKEKNKYFFKLNLQIRSK